MKLRFTQGEESFFRDLVDIPDPPRPFDIAAKKTKTLVRYLMDKVEGPEQWVTLSHEIIFYLTDKNTWHPEKAKVFVSPARYGFEVKYRSARELDWENSFTILKAHSMEEAGVLIVKALELAIKDLD